MSDSGRIVIELPRGMMGPSPDEAADSLDAMLRRIAVAIAKSRKEDPLAEWVEKYGTNFENAEFMMHRQCYCDRQSCRWCQTCDCPASAFHHMVDGKEVTYDEWMAFYKRASGPCPELADYAGRDWGWDDWKPDPQAEAAYRAAHAAWDKRADAANARRTQRQDPVCEYCTKYNGRNAPNFLHKPTGMMVFWYKYIGRGTELVIPSGQVVEYPKIEAACIASLPA